MNKFGKRFALGVLALISVPFVAADTGDVLVRGLELDKVLNLGSALVATVLFALTLIAHHRQKNSRLLFVSIAFGVIAVKGFLLASQMVLGDFGWVDPAASVMDFAMMLCFFFGVLKK